MQTVKTKQKVQNTVKAWKQDGKTVALVATMGNLHEGHLKLVDYALQHADKVVVSIFVNPTQFGKNEDIDNYPRTLEHDSAQLAERKADLLFAPEVSEIYVANTGLETQVIVPELSDVLCGEFRPGHFVGVTTVVAKLFNIVLPDVAIFGKKDFQQLFLINKMVADLDFPVKVMGVETMREDDGLAMSSRNTYLTEEQRKLAPILYQTLTSVSKNLLDTKVNLREQEQYAAKILEKSGLLAEYVSIRRVTDLQPAGSDDRELVILAAVKCGKARLIDNITLNI